MATETADEPVTYNEDNMKTLKDAAHIRQNPGMYVGNTSSSGLHHLVFEVAYNSVDEALAGYCKLISIAIQPDGSVAISDDGRGIPVGIKADTGKSTLEEALTVAGTSGKFDNAAYRVSAGLHGMGAKAMNALSEWCEAEVRREGRIWKMEFERGYATGPLQNLGPTTETGTTITFKPDPEVFGDIAFNYDLLSDRFREIAYLNKGLAIAISDERDGRSEQFKSDGGIAEYVAFLNTGEIVEHNPLYFQKTVNSIQVEVSLQYSNRDEKIERCYANNAFNPDGGTHLSGFRSGLTRALTTYGKKNDHFKDSLELKGEDFREGLTAVISIGHPDPLFESQTKVKLNNPEVDGIVGSVVYEMLSEFLEKNPKDGTRICRRIALSAEARIAAKKARDAIIDRKRLLGGGGLPGKLMDCSTKDREKSELFLVEGDSAGGSAEGGRDRFYQAVLPLRGKVLNVEKAEIEKLLKNEEIASLISAVGVDIGNAEDTTKLRYGKIVILTDADVDGQHIRTLLLTFFFRQMRKLVEEGRIFVARPPLFKVTQKKEVRFVQTREAMSEELMSRGLKDAELVVHTSATRTTEQTFDSATLQKFLPILSNIDDAVSSIERRGQPFVNYMKEAKDGKFPAFNHLKASVGQPKFYTSLEEAPEAIRAEIDEWHEVSKHSGLNAALAKLKEFGFVPTDLVPLQRVAGREPINRYTLINGDHRKELSDLRELVLEIRKMGEKGMTITRFKGLGEMDPEELWDTTLDPVRRTMLKVTMADVLQAEKMFRMLMGKEVEGRRDFILKHRANVEDIDYGA